MAYLFDKRATRLPQNWRWTDPTTSRAAGEQHEASGDAEIQRYRVTKYVRANPGCTAREIGAALGFAAHKRMKEIETKGSVKRGERRPCRVTGVTVDTWEPV